MINRLDVNKKTLYGADIISDILRKEYPEDEIVMSIKGRDCGICRNPFDGGNQFHPECDGMAEAHIENRVFSNQRRVMGFWTLATIRLCMPSWFVTITHNDYDPE